MAELEIQTQHPDFWNDNVAAQKTMREVNVRKDWVTAYNGAASCVDDVAALLELADEAGDDSMERELDAEMASLI
ncbi:MAG: PCRF domain-containing protein, partial [bacterium]|nr:PCRF domain-containing protein [Candidatus Kapabacteria bacterium]